MRTRRLLAIALAGLIAAGVLALASGRIGYVTTYGVSMEPTYSGGDLVLVVRDGDYAVGDKVAYPDPGTGDTVLHRIVDRQGDGFVLQGDNNDSIDPHQPTAAELAGRAVAHVPALGGLLGSPVTRGLLLVTVAGLTGSLALPTGKQAVPRTSARNPGPRSRAGRKGRHRRPRSRIRTVWLALLVADVVLAACAVAAFAARPSSPVDAGPVEHQLAFTYGAEVAESATYPDGRVGTGETLFRSFADALDVSARTVTDGTASQASGAARLDLTVSSSAGWARTVTLVDRTEFTGDLDLEATIDLGEIDRLAERISFETGVGSGTIDLSVELVGRAGVEGGEPVELDASWPLRVGSQAVTMPDAEITMVDGTPAVVSSVELPSAPVADDTTAGARPDLTRPALGALLLALGITGVVWPTGRDDGDGDGDGDGGTTLRIHTTGVQRAVTATVVEVAPEELEAIARRSGSPILWRDDGWEGVLTADVLYSARTAGAVPVPDTAPENGRRTEQRT